MDKRGGVFGIIIVIILIAILLALGGWFIFSGNEAQNTSDIDANDVNSDQDQFLDNQTDSGGGNESGVSDINNSVSNATDNNITQSNETNSSLDFKDLEATDLVLVSDGCTEATNTTNAICSLSITGVLTNSGTVPVSEDFVVHFFDLTDGSDLIDIIQVADDLAAGQEKEIALTYDNLSRMKYFIKFVVDPVYNVDEDNEDNNQITKNIKP